MSAAETSVFDREDNEIYLILEDFVQTHPQEAGVFSGGKAAADYIAERFGEEGLADVKQTTFYYGMDSSQNVSAYTRSTGDCADGDNRRSLRQRRLRSV